MTTEKDKGLRMFSVRSVAQTLAAQFGGKWKYDNHGTWHGPDGAEVRCVATCACDDVCDCGRSYYLYRQGESPKAVYL